MKKKLNLFKIIIIVCCLLSFIGLILPYQSATQSYKKELQKNPYKLNMKGTDLYNEDAINISLIEQFKVYSSTLDTLNSREYRDMNVSGIKSVAAFNRLFIIVLIASTVLVLLCAIFNRRVLSIIFSLSLLGSSLMIKAYATETIGSNYKFGISYHLYPVLAIVIIISTIVLIVKNKKQKNNNIVNNSKN